MNFYDFAQELLNARDYLKFNKIIINPDIVTFVDINGEAHLYNEVEVSINGNCIQLMVK